MNLDAVREITISSNQINTWALSIVGGSLLTILGADFIRPVKKLWRLVYLLFIPGWIFLGLSIAHGGRISRRQIMAVMQPEKVTQVIEKMNDEFMDQLWYFNAALIFFGTWLFLFLFWWIFQDKTK